MRNLKGLSITSKRSVTEKKNQMYWGPNGTNGIKCCRMNWKLNCNKQWKLLKYSFGIQFWEILIHPDRKDLQNKFCVCVWVGGGWMNEIEEMCLWSHEPWNGEPVAKGNRTDFFLNSCEAYRGFEIRIRVTDGQTTIIKLEVSWVVLQGIEKNTRLKYRLQIR